MQTDQKHMGNVDEHLSPPPGPAAAKDAHPIRVNPCLSVSYICPFSDPGSEQP
jgi:hypothetical protein